MSRKTVYTSNFTFGFPRQSTKATWSARRREKRFTGPDTGVHLGVERKILFWWKWITIARATKMHMSWHTRSQRSKLFTVKLITFLDVFVSLFYEKEMWGKSPRPNVMGARLRCTTSSVPQNALKRISVGLIQIDKARSVVINNFNITFSRANRATAATDSICFDKLFFSPLLDCVFGFSSAVFLCLSGRLWH